MTTLINILIVDDSADDVEFTMTALRNTKLANDISVVNDGVEALQYLRKEAPFENAKNHLWYYWIPTCRAKMVEKYCKR